MTGGSEDKGKTEAWVEDKGVEYTWAYDTGGIIGAAGPGYYPGTVLVDPFGTIVYVGGPSEMPKGDLKDLLKQSLPSPISEWPEEAAPIAEAMASRNAAQMIAAAEATNVKGVSKEVIKFAEAMVKSRVSGLKDLIADMNISVAVKFAEAAKDQLAGRDELEDVTKLAAKLEDDKYRAALGAQERLATIEAQMPGRGETGGLTEGQVEDLIDELEGLAKKYKKKAPGRRADGMIRAWKEVARLF